MSRTARVTSIETVERFRSALCEFGKDAQDTLCAVDMQIRRAFDWLAERTKYWQKEIKVRQELVVRAKIELQTRKIMCKDGRGPGTTDQEKALRKANAALKQAEEKLANCKRWQPLLQHAVHEFQGPARLLSAALDTDLVHSLALLAQKLTALEAYLALAPPSLPEPVPATSTAESPLPVASTGTVTPVEQPASKEPIPEENLLPGLQPTEQH
jgi:hypothetical protein